MSINLFETVYLGVSFKESLQLKREQLNVCNIQLLIPRPEFHITIAYFGKLSKESIEIFGTCLKPLISDGMKKYRIKGLGGAYQNEKGELNTIYYIKETSHLKFPRVFWWAIENNDALIDFRNAMISIAFSLNLPSTYLRPSFSPHITIGSSGPKNDTEDWSLWDVHSIQKNQTVKDLNIKHELELNRVHLTSIPIQPESLFKIYEIS